MKDEKNQTDQTIWELRLKSLNQLIWLFLYGLLIFFIYRAALLFHFRNTLYGTTSVDDIGRSLWVSLHFDIAVCAIFLIAPVFVTIFFKSNLPAMYSRVNRFFGYIFFFVFPFICILDYYYFIEFEDQFNSQMFEALYDDLTAILKTVSAEFHPLLNIALLFISGMSLFFLWNYSTKKVHLLSFLKGIDSRWRQRAVLFLFLLITLISARGSLKKRPIKRIWSYVSSSELINKTIINPVKSLYYAYIDYIDLKKMLSNSSSKFKKRPISGILDNLFGIKDLDKFKNITKHKAAGNDNPPEHIFFIVFESLDAWMLDKDTPDSIIWHPLRELARDGILFRNFLPSSIFTITSLGSIITGIPYFGINAIELYIKHGPYKSSVFSTFKRLGYQTSYFDGGFLSFDKSGIFMKSQGADRVYSAAVESGMLPEEGIWGAEEEKLFKTVLDKLNPEKKTFSIILTVNTHEPYSLDIFRLGFPIKRMDQVPQDLRSYIKNRKDLIKFGHYWYCIRALYDFINNAKERFPNSLFVITGDHYSGRSKNDMPTIRASSFVPLILLGHGIDKKGVVSEIPANHIDIMPTLVELSAPSDFIYWSLGVPLLSEPVKQRKVVFGFNRFIYRDSVCILQKREEILCESLSQKRKYRYSNKELVSKYKDYLTLGWFLSINDF